LQVVVLVEGMLDQELEQVGIEILSQVSCQVVVLLLKHQQLLAQELYIQLLLELVVLEPLMPLEQMVQHPQ
jgi:hypothetical protein